MYVPLDPAKSYRHRMSLRYILNLGLMLQMTKMVEGMKKRIRSKVRARLTVVQSSCRDGKLKMQIETTQKQQSRILI